MTEMFDTGPMSAAARRWFPWAAAVILGGGLSALLYLGIKDMTSVRGAEFKVGATLPEAEPIGEVPGYGGRIYKLKVPGGTLYVLEHGRNGQPGPTAMTVLKD